MSHHRPSWLPHLLPQTFRVRLALLYAGMFLAAGAILLAVTYGLVAHSLPGSTSLTIQEAKAEFTCKTLLHQTGGKGSSHTPIAIPANCKNVFYAGAKAEASGQRAQTLHNLLLFSLLGLGLTTVLAGLLGAIMAGRTLRPVKAITAAARRASTEHLGERIRLQGPRDELKELADTFDVMLDRLDSAFASQRRFVADASHELRTPLTVMRTAIDVTMAKKEPSPEQMSAMVARIRRAIDKAELLVEALLTLAMSERDIHDAVPVDLATLAEDALEDSSVSVTARGLHVDADLEAAPVVGNRVLLERMVANLVENAVRYNVDGGSLSLRSGNGEARSWIEVRNTGASVEESQVEDLFAPFHRAQRTSGGGVGLGLAIVRSIADRHDGEIEATPGSDGGLCVRVLLPAVGRPGPPGST